MMRFILTILAITVALSFLHSIQVKSTQKTILPLKYNNLPNFETPANNIENIPLPENFKRIEAKKGSFSEWIRKRSLKPKGNLYLYNKQLSKHQNWHYAILAETVQPNGLQQCADAIMKLKAEYLFESNQLSKIVFHSKNKVFNFKETYPNSPAKQQLEDFLSQVFAYCGTYNLEEMTYEKKSFNDIMPSDILVKAGSPGHAMLVADVAENTVTHEKIYVLLQSYTPSEDVHIVKNPLLKNNSPWYSINGSSTIYTPGYWFIKQNLRTWK